MLDEDLGTAERARLVSRYGRQFMAGEAVFREGEPAQDAFLLQEGRVRLLKRVRMVERSLMVLKPGDLFGESALLDAAARNSFRSLLVNYPSVAVRVMEQLVRRVRDAEDQIEIMLLRDAQYKIVSALLKLAQRADAKGTGAELAVSPVELATRVGLDVDTVKRNVARLREQSYVRIVGERIEIPDLDALRRLYVLLGTKDELQGER
jgi:CRP-like cAMP-binding protein